MIQPINSDRYLIKKNESTEEQIYEYSNALFVTTKNCKQPKCASTDE